MSYGQRGRHRWMFKLTGQPGWMRLGFSPGWVGRSQSGLPPTAEWLTQSGNLPQFQSWLASRQSVTPPVTPTGNIPQNIPVPSMTMTKEQETQILKQQLDFLQAQIEQISKRLEELKVEE